MSASEQREDGEGNSGSSETSVGETDRYGFLLGNGDTQNNSSDEPCPQLVRHREMKWLNLISQWDQVVEKKHSKVKSQCQKGIPASVRSKCWPLLCGATHRKIKNENLYEELENAPGQQGWIDVIKRDTDRQFPFHEMFLSKDGLGQQGLLKVLKAYTQFRPEEGYCQAQGPVAAVLLMNMPVEEAFWCLVQISDLYLPGYYSPLLEGVLFDAAVLSSVIKRMCPPAHKHMQSQGVEPLMFATDWLMCLYSRHLPFNTLLRVWDLFFCYGARVLFQVAVVLVRRCLGEARQRKECEGQMETLERLRGVRSLVQHEPADAFIHEVCSVALSLGELQRLTDKQYDKWKKERPGSTFDPRDRCHGYHMAWEKGKKEDRENEMKERQKGNLAIPLTQTHSSHSPAFLRKGFLRKRGSKVETEDWETGGKRLSQGVKEEGNDGEKRRTSTCATPGEIRTKTEQTAPELDTQSQKDLRPNSALSVDSETVFEEEENVEGTTLNPPTNTTHTDCSSRDSQMKTLTITKDLQSENGQQETESLPVTEQSQDDKQEHHNEEKPTETNNEDQDEEMPVHQEEHRDETQQEEELLTQTSKQEEDTLPGSDEHEGETESKSSNQEEEIDSRSNKHEEETESKSSIQDEEMCSTNSQQEEELDRKRSEEEIQQEEEKQEKELQTNNTQQVAEVEVNRSNIEEEEIQVNICTQEEKLELNEQEKVLQVESRYQPEEIEVSSGEDVVNEDKQIKSEHGEKTMCHTEEEEIKTADNTQKEEIEIFSKKEEEIQLDSCDQEKGLEYEQETKMEVSIITQEVDVQASSNVQGDFNKQEEETESDSSKQEVEIQVSDSKEEKDNNDPEKETEVDSNKVEVEVQDSSRKQEVEVQDSSSKQEVEVQDSSCKQEVEVQDSSSKQEVEAQDSSSKQEVEAQDSSSKQEVEVQDSSCKQEVEVQDSSSKQEVEAQDSSSKQEVEAQDSSSKQEVEEQTTNNNGINKIQIECILHKDVLDEEPESLETPSAKEQEKVQLQCEQTESATEEETEKQTDHMDVTQACDTQMEEEGRIQEEKESNRELLEETETEAQTTDTSGEASGSAALEEEEEEEEEEQDRKDEEENSNNHIVDEEASQTNVSSPSTCIDTTQGIDLEHSRTAQPPQTVNPEDNGTPADKTADPEVTPDNSEAREGGVSDKEPQQSGEGEMPINALEQNASVAVQPPTQPTPMSKGSSSNPHNPLRLRRSSSSRASYPTILCEDTFRDPNNIDTQTQAASDAPQVPQQPQAASVKADPALTEVPTSVSKPDTGKDARKTEKQVQAQKPKRKGLFHIFRAEAAPKSPVPKILIQDFSEGEEKLTSKERRRRRRERERREKEEEKERKKKEKEVEKEKERERKKPQTRGKSFQVLSRKSDDGDGSANSGLQTIRSKRNSVPHSESYF